MAIDPILEEAQREYDRDAEERFDELDWWLIPLVLLLVPVGAVCMIVRGLVALCRRIAGPPKRPF